MPAKDLTRVPCQSDTRDEILKPLKRGGESYDTLLCKMASQYRPTEHHDDVNFVSEDAGGVSEVIRQLRCNAVEIKRGGHGYDDHSEAYRNGVVHGIRLATDYIDAEMEE